MIVVPYLLSLVPRKLHCMSHFLEDLNQTEKIQLFEIFEQSPELMYYFEQSHTRKERALVQKDKDLLAKIIAEEKGHIARLLKEIRLEVGHNED